MLIGKHVDAIFIVGIYGGNKENIKAIENTAKQIPVIVINGALETEIDNTYCIVCNEKNMAASIVQQLCLSGYSRIAYIYDTTTYSGVKKLEGYRKGLKQCNLSYEDLTLQISEDISMTDISSTAREIEDFFHSCEIMPDAVMTADDVLAVAVLKALEQIGTEMPLIGWNNSLFSQCCTPTLTTVDINMEKMSETAVLILLKVLEGKQPPKYIEVHARWIERQTYCSGFETNGSDAEGDANSD